MSGAVKAGLLFGLIGLVVIFVVSMLAQFELLPRVSGALGRWSLLVSCTGPLTAGLVGGAAGYAGLRWSPAEAGMGAGLRASALAGLGLLLGGLAFFMTVFAMSMADPAFRQIYQETVRDLVQPQARGVSEEQALAMMGAVGPLGGLCIGTINLLAALLGGLVGSWLASSPARRARAA